MESWELIAAVPPELLGVSGTTGLQPPVLPPDTRRCQDPESAPVPHAVTLGHRGVTANRDAVPVARHERSRFLWGHDATTWRLRI